MARLFALVLGLLVGLSLGVASVAHAAEPSGGFTPTVAVSSLVSIDHSQGDRDQVPADADKAYPHHHGGCHGHHELVSLDRPGFRIAHSASVGPRPGDVPHLPMSPSDPGLRPTRA